MAIDVGSQILLCDLPVRVDTYSGCSHACSYCFVKRKFDIERIEAENCVKSIASFVAGKRTKKTQWIDWKIPLHFGGMSDPFQPIERKHRVSKRAMEIFNAAQYPVVLSTKGELFGDSEYMELLSKGNYVLQVSHVSPKYDAAEPGAPSYEKRLELMAEASNKVKRLIVRVQPYIPEALFDVLSAIPRYKKAGVYGVIVEGMKYQDSRPGTTRFFGDCVYALKILKPHFEAIRKACHEEGMKFFSGENRLRSMGDSLNCCGSDGVPGFVANKVNLNHFHFDKKNFKYTEAHRIEGTGSAFRAMTQGNSSCVRVMDTGTYEDAMEMVSKSSIRDVVS